MAPKARPHLVRGAQFLVVAGLGAASGSLRTVAADQGFAFKQISKSIIGAAHDSTAEVCETECLANEDCVAWQVCAPLGSGCDGCYHLRNRPEIITVSGWSAGVNEERAAAKNLTVGEQVPLPSNKTMPLTLEGCAEYVLNANGGQPDSDLNLVWYNRCGEMLRQTDAAKNVTVLGQHWPTTLVTNFREPSLLIPPEVEEQRRGPGNTVPDSAYYEPGGPGSVTAELHQSSNTEVLSKTKNHAFVLPFYDTNIAHGIMQMGTMNILQNYEMQSLLRPGDVVVDVGANLGSYTVPFAERVGRQGKVLAFEPFRWLYQLTTANVALNGLSNVHVYNMALGESKRTFQSRPPQLRFFSSPGGSKVNYADQDGKPGAQETENNLNLALQMYDFESDPEETLMIGLDQLLTPGETDIKVPPINNLKLIKIDVEGMESNVILGAQSTIYQFKPIIWSENVDYFEKNDVKFISIMDQLEYSCAKAPSAPQDLVCTDKYGRGHQFM